MGTNSGDHAAKVTIPARSPSETLDALAPMGENSYGTMVRRNKGLRLYRSDTVQIESLYGNEVESVSTLWALQYVDKVNYTAKVTEQTGHFHADAKQNLVGFCPNEQLSFNRVNEILNLLKESAAK